MLHAVSITITKIEKHLQRFVRPAAPDGAVLYPGLGHELLGGGDGVGDAGDGEEGGEVGGVAAHDQHHEHPPGGHHHPARGRSETDIYLYTI